MSFPGVSRTARVSRTNSQILLGIGVSAILVVFGFTLYFSASTIDHAIRHAGYSSSFNNGTSFGVFSSGPPSYSEAGWLFLLGPVLQLALFGSFVGLASLTSRPLRRRIAIATLCMVGVDVLYMVVFYVMAEAAVI